MNEENEGNHVDLADFIGHHVVDREGETVGRLECLWQDHNGKPAFIGVHSGWLVGRTHVVPLDGTEVNAVSRIIRLAYTQEHVRQAPTAEPGVTLDEGTERAVCDFYDLPWDRKPPEERTATPQEEAHLQLHKEELKVGKRQVVYGGVRVRKIVRTETVQVPVELRREEIVIERIPADEANACIANQAAPALASGAPHGNGGATGDEEIFIPLMREEPVVEKERHVTEEVHLTKQMKTEHQTVSDQVRKEEVHIEKSPTRKRGRAKRAQGAQFASGAHEPPQHAGRRAVFGIVRTQAQALAISEDLRSSGFAREDISVIFSDRDSTREFARESGTKAPEGAVAGAATGAGVGGALGWLAGIGGLAIPGLGPFVAAGPIMAALRGAAVGGAAGGLTGALVGLGIPEQDAQRYQGRLQEGNIFISVHCDSERDARRALDIFAEHGAEDVASANEAAAH